MESNPLNMTSLVAAKENLLFCELQDEMVLLDVESGTYFGIDPVGVLIWNSIQTPVTLGYVRDAVMGEFDVDQEQCERDVISFVDNLVKQGLAEIKG
jgi:hypothetical protein